jgi:selenoprotein W-related protein
MQKYEADVEKLTLIPSDGGRFEVDVNGELIYSKLETRRHLETGEGLRLIHDYLKQHT